MRQMRRVGAAAAGLILVVAVGCSSDDASPDREDTTTTTVGTATEEPGTPEIGLADVHDAYVASGNEYAELMDDPALEFDPERLGAVEAGEIDFMMDCGISTIEVYVFADAEAAQTAAEQMEAEIEAFSCAAPGEGGDAGMASLYVGVNENVVGVSESTSYVADFEDLDLGGGSAAS